MKRILIVLSLVASATARADVTPLEQPAGGERYAGRIVAADIGALALFSASGYFALLNAFGEGPSAPIAVFATAGIATYAAGSPLLHLHRGNPRGAMRSAVARIGLPIVGASLAYSSGRQGDVANRPIIGAVTGIGVAMILDWTVLARMPTTKAMPFVAPAADGGASAGIAGSF